MDYDYLIVGAGIAGCSLAYQLTKSNQASVLVLEQESQPGYHSTGRSAAMFIETYGTPTIRALTIAGHDFYANPPAGFAEQPILKPRGVLFVGTLDQQALLEDAYQAFRKQELDVRMLTPEQAKDLVSCLKADQLAGAVYDPEGSDIDVHVLHQGYLKGMRQQGAELRCNAQLTGASWDGSSWIVNLDGHADPIRAHTLVNAAGAWADHVASLCNVAPLGIQPKRRSAFLFPPPPGVNHTLWPAVIGIDESFYFKPDAGMLLGSPANADPVPAHDVVAEELDIATGIYHIEAMTDLKIRRPSHTWAGLRSFALDGEFVIGWDTTKGFFWHAGQGGYGIQTAAGVSLLAASLLRHEPLPSSLNALSIDPAVVSPTRFRETS